MDVDMIDKRYMQVGELTVKKEQCRRVRNIEKI